MPPDGLWQSPQTSKESTRPTAVSYSTAFAMTRAM